MRFARAAAIVVLPVAAAGCAWFTNLVICDTPCARPPSHLPEGIAEREPPPPPGGKEPVAPSCGTTGAPAASFGEVQRILRGSCGAAGVCHLAGDQSEAGLDYASPDLHSELVGRNAEGAGRCRKEDRVDKRVVAGHPEESMLYRVVSGNDCGAHMPLGGAYLSCSDQRTIYGWIASGAPGPVDGGVAMR
jgi:hypothetical protein